MLSAMWIRGGGGFGPVVSIVLAVLVGCAAPTWSRSGASAAELAADRAACVEASGNRSGVMNLATARFVDRCLQERGWRRGADPNPAAGVVKSAPLPVPPATALPRGPGLEFDGCFERCRALTPRSEEQCFDVCLAAENERQR